LTIGQFFCERFQKSASFPNGTVQKCASLVDLEKCFKMNTRSASIQPRTGIDNFALWLGLASPDLGSFSVPGWDLVLRPGHTAGGAAGCAAGCTDKIQINRSPFSRIALRSDKIRQKVACFSPLKAAKKGEHVAKSRESSSFFRMLGEICLANRWGGVNRTRTWPLQAFSKMCSCCSNLAIFATS
jgi:hypothetical protein